MITNMHFLAISDVAYKNDTTDVLTNIC